MVRLPENVRACCVPLDPGHPGATATLMNAIDSGSFVNGHVNLELRNAAKDGLKRAFRFPH
jgi:hypothetical protein